MKVKEFQAMLKKDTLHVNGLDIGVYTTDFKNDYISLTDIARYKNDDDPRFAIQNWMRNRDTFELLGVWEELHNPNFNRVQFNTFKTETGLHRFVMTPTKWINATNAIGMMCKSGRYQGGTYAHSDIALNFATWISPEFQLYILKDYQRLKQDENSRLSLNWNLNREIAKLNYRIHTDAIKDNLLLPELTRQQMNFVYADEADVLNVALFGMTAREWRDGHKKSKYNIRDGATLQQLLVLANMESYNAVMISQGLQQAERMQKLREMAISQLHSLQEMNLGMLPNK